MAGAILTSTVLWLALATTVAAYGVVPRPPHPEHKPTNSHHQPAESQSELVKAENREYVLDEASASRYWDARVAAGVPQDTVPAGSQDITSNTGSDVAAFGRPMTPSASTVRPAAPTAKINSYRNTVTTAKTTSSAYKKPIVVRPMPYVSSVLPPAAHPAKGYGAPVTTTTTTSAPTTTTSATTTTTTAAPATTVADEPSAPVYGAYAQKPVAVRPIPYRPSVLPPAVHPAGGYGASSTTTTTSAPTTTTSATTTTTSAAPTTTVADKPSAPVYGAYAQPVAPTTTATVASTSTSTIPTTTAAADVAVTEPIVLGYGSPMSDAAVEIEKEVEELVAEEEQKEKETEAQTTSFTYVLNQDAASAYWATAASPKQQSTKKETIKLTPKPVAPTTTTTTVASTSTSTLQTSTAAAGVAVTEPIVLGYGSPMLDAAVEIEKEVEELVAEEEQKEKETEAQTKSITYVLNKDAASTYWATAATPKQESNKKATIKLTPKKPELSSEKKKLLLQSMMSDIRKEKLFDQYARQPPKSNSHYKPAAQMFSGSPYSSYSSY